MLPRVVEIFKEQGPVVLGDKVDDHFRQAVFGREPDAVGDVRVSLKFLAKQAMTIYRREIVYGLAHRAEPIRLQHGHITKPDSPFPGGRMAGDRRHDQHYLGKVQTGQ
ncbi:MAG TPA: hypothetical protein VFX82_08670 [Desulfobacterales bacterium]|nr:hypothetical protein [Desulfobacterales bacterium]